MSRCDIKSNLVSGIYISYKVILLVNLTDDEKISIL